MSNEIAQVAVWWLYRVGHEDGDLVSMAVASESAIFSGLRFPLLRGQVRDDPDTGSSHIVRITHNAAHLPTDDAVAMLLTIHRQVEGCDHGEVAAFPILLTEWLHDLFDRLHAELVASLLWVCVERTCTN